MLTKKGTGIMTSMMNTYGSKKKAERVFYASRNAGRITGVERKRSHYPGASMHDSALHAHQARHGIEMQSLPKMRQMMQRLMGR